MEVSIEVILLTVLQNSYGRTYDPQVESYDHLWLGIQNHSLKSKPDAG